MSTIDREDIIESEELEKYHDIDNIEFNKLMGLLITFTSNFLISDSELRKLKIGSEIIPVMKIHMHVAEMFQKNSVSMHELSQHRVQAWELFDRMSPGSVEKHLARIIVCCLFDRKAAEFDQYGSGAMFETIFSSLLDLGAGYCRMFTSYAKDYLATP